MFDTRNIEAELDKEGNEKVAAYVVETPTAKYACSIILTLQDTDSLNAAPFQSEPIMVESHNSQTGFEVDEQRNNAILNYLKTINNV